MSESIKATRATVAIGDLVVDAFMLPDGSYRMSQTQAADLVGLTERNAREFLDSKTFERLAGDGFTPAIFDIDSEQSRGQSRFRGLPLEVVVIYWVYQCYRGNKKAFALLIALATESLERRFDNAFGMVRTEQERNDTTTARIKALESDLANLGEGFAIDDDIRQERDYLLSVLRDNGLDPYILPEGDRDNIERAN
jgi:cell division protein FtsB